MRLRAGLCLVVERERAARHVREEVWLAAAELLAEENRCLQKKAEVAEFHAEVNQFTAQVAGSPEHGLSRDPRGLCPWVVKLSNLFQRH